MKRKVAVMVMLALALGGASAYAAKEDDPHYQEMKKYKAEQRAKKEAEKSNPSPKKPGFWDREGERSGLSGTGQGISGFLKKLNPAPFFKNQQEKYEARKAAGTK